MRVTWHRSSPSNASNKSEREATSGRSKITGAEIPTFRGIARIPIRESSVVVRLESRSAAMAHWSSIDRWLMANMVSSRAGIISIVFHATRAKRIF
jgi:hypothetical protein